MESLPVIRPGAAADADAAHEIENLVWAPFHYEGDEVIEWDYDTALWVVAEDTRQIIATADGCLVDWDGDPRNLPPSWMEVLRRSSTADPAGRWASALGTSILPEHRGGGLGARMLVGLKEQATQRGMRGMLAPARPSARHSWPQMTLADYAALRLDDGRHADPWIRAHEAIGGHIIGWCERSLEVHAAHEVWERWAGYRLPSEGRCLFPRSIGWLELSGGQGCLTEDSIWILHPIDPDLVELLSRTRPDEIEERRSLLSPAEPQPSGSAI